MTSSSGKNTAPHGLPEFGFGQFIQTPARNAGRKSRIGVNLAPGGESYTYSGAHTNRADDVIVEEKTSPIAGSEI